MDQLTFQKPFRMLNFDLGTCAMSNVKRVIQLQARLGTQITKSLNPESSGCRRINQSLTKTARNYSRGAKIGNFMNHC